MGLSQGCETVPWPSAATGRGRTCRDVGVVDWLRSEEITDDGRAAAEPHAATLRGRRGHRERVGGRGIGEVKCRAALHLDRRARVMGQDEDRRMERRVGTPPAPPVGVVLPSGEPVISGPPYLRAAAGLGPADPGVVAPPGAPGRAAPSPPPTSPPPP